MNSHKIWRDGTFVDWQDATIHVMSHVVHYGSSIFEVDSVRASDLTQFAGLLREELEDGVLLVGKQVRIRLRLE